MARIQFALLVVVVAVVVFAVVAAAAAGREQYNGQTTFEWQIWEQITRQMSVRSANPETQNEMEMEMLADAQGHG